MLQSGKADLFDQASEVKSLIEKNKKITPTSNTVKKANKMEEENLKSKTQSSEKTSLGKRPATN